MPFRLNRVEVRRVDLPSRAILRAILLIRITLGENRTKGS